LQASATLTLQQNVNKSAECLDYLRNAPDMLLKCEWNVTEMWSACNYHPCCAYHPPGRGYISTASQICDKIV